MRWIIALLSTLPWMITAAPLPEKPIVFVAPVDYSPWVIINDKGTVTGGILYEMAHTIGETVGLPVKVEAMPFPRFEELIPQQDFDFTFVNHLQPMTGGILFPKVVTTTQLGLIYLSKNAKFADCSKMRSIAHTSQNSAALRALIQQKCGTTNIINTQNLGQRVKMLGKERVDAFLGSNEEMDLIGYFGQPCRSVSFVPFFDMNWHIFVSDKSPLAKEPYRTRLERFIAAYEPEHYDRIRHKVLGSHYCPKARKF